jgi:hypothetical protein
MTRGESKGIGKEYVRMGMKYEEDKATLVRCEG